MPITSNSFAELGMEAAFPIQSEGTNTGQLYEVKLTFPRSSSIWTDDQLVEQFARSLMILGDESRYDDMTSSRMIQRMREQLRLGCTPFLLSKLQLKTR